MRREFDSADKAFRAARMLKNKMGIWTGVYRLPDGKYALVHDVDPYTGE